MIYTEGTKVLLRVGKQATIIKQLSPTTYVMEFKNNDLKFKGTRLVTQEELDHQPIEWNVDYSREK